MKLEQIALQLRSELRKQKFGPPVACVYNPLEYAWRIHSEYLRRFGREPREVLLLGMNPGPWGMVQTGIPFGDVAMVSGWLGIEGKPGGPDVAHPRRPVSGFLCHRREISGARLWGWARDTLGTPQAFFERFFVANYCPLCFFDAGGENRTPDRLPAADRERLFEACDRAVRATVAYLKPRLVVGIGRFAESRARASLAGMPVEVANAIHPSGANPRAGRDWGGQMTATLRALKIKI